MKSIGIYYGSSTDTTADIANRIAGSLGVAQSEVHNVADADPASVAKYEVLLLGSSTWGAGDLQDDWEDFLPKLKAQDLSGKVVGLFGCGDASCYGDTFCDALATIKEGLAGSGCTFAGNMSKDGYSFDESRSEEDGELIGCLLDEANESDMTDERIDRWIAALKPQLG
ncbi:flavodoxin [Porphyromonas crevioricanis]|uniref:Flavodoxin n=2 Tax=Porphyromonas crevioricanis TaxID=393921 RepID=A0A0A2G4K5_9PORP|nr:flavodoxin [Porphyromonas crevioricanis]KGN91286.1 flavodoxin [Porphyromonas crevioricanis]KGN95384.1 flavodoxin [Porphyromonas crevioricanis]SKA01043.1 flavodoxin I [Porphyromonas crevioricanis]SQH72991.1 Flavodoxin-1 [Porphyromonas crevioricanis]GAD05739.1 flavodoxin 1 [Porphyromonas crevioricanis JCM 15906]